MSEKGPYKTAERKAATRIAKALEILTAFPVAEQLVILEMAGNALVNREYRMTGNQILSMVRFMKQGF
jgi:hypothetical protein